MSQTDPLAARARDIADLTTVSEEWVRGYCAAVEKIATVAACVYGIDIEAVDGNCEDTVIRLLDAAIRAGKSCHAEFWEEDYD